MGRTGWPTGAEELVKVQLALGHEALTATPWRLPDNDGQDLRIGGCFVAFARGEAGPGHPGDRAWAAAVTWRPASAPTNRQGQPFRRPDQALRGTGPGGPRQSSDVLAQAVVADRVPASYARGLLALREGPILEAAVAALDPPPDVLLVDATGLDHPRGAGLAIHLGAVAGLPTVGVTHRPLQAMGALPPMVRGRTSPLYLDDHRVGAWVCTRTGVRPLVAHAGWRTDPETATSVVLQASTEAARTPVPLEEARRVAREARALAGAA
jgi:deoxyribonuclease V